jgi:hypothetical protein
MDEDRLRVWSSSVKEDAAIMFHRTSVFAASAIVVSIIGLLAPAGEVTSQTQSPIDRAGHLLAEARASFARVRDYTGTVVRQERIGGELQPEQYMEFRIRQQPFSVALKWTAPRNLAGQEAIYVAGKNNNEIRAKGSGILGVVGYVSLPTNDPRVMKKCRHSITESGIGNMLDVISRSYEAARRLPAGQVTVSFADFAFQQRPCTRMELTHNVYNPQLYCYRCVVFVDRELKLPVRVEVYDWPQRNGDRNGELLECYSYINLRFNQGLTDAAFEPSDRPARASAR